MEHIQYTYAVCMNPGEVSDCLRESSSGVLALARDDEAYGFPVDFDFDGSSLYVRLCEHPGSKKRAFAEATTRATLVVQGSDDEGPWSVLGRGRLRRLDAAEQFDEAALNARFPPACLYDAAVEDVDPVVYRFDWESFTGRRTGE